MGKLGIPFMLAGVAAVGAGKINSTRVVEAVVIACVSSALMATAGYFIALPVIQEQVSTVRRDISEVKEEMKAVRVYQESRRQFRDAEQAKTDAKINQIQIELAKRK